MLSWCSARTDDDAISLATIPPTTEPTDPRMLLPLLACWPPDADLSAPPPSMRDPTRLPTIPARAATVPIVAASSASLIPATVSSNASM
ncbi:unnamed protein product [Pseudo-nitzschia multistriata]|uniref:Uncharacterized protein n=1 Tax=Pseudo-nitzschia multistriata TaxID=183589 RepID=A0A448ZN14_9STRA|nr:unnamed protein product [Pseudo-nitzschia multistriata]